MEKIIGHGSKSDGEIAAEGLSTDRGLSDAERALKNEPVDVVAAEEQAEDLSEQTGDGK